MEFFLSEPEKKSFPEVIKRIILLPARDMTLTIPVSLTLGMLGGYFFDTTSLKTLVLPVTFMMIYPNMIGFELGELARLSDKKVILAATFINFAVLPLVAYVLGHGFLSGNPHLFVGLAITSLLPTTNMTIHYAIFSKGNVNAAIKLTIFSLVAGSFLAPWYLYLMVGKYVPVDIWVTFKTVATIIFIPLILGVLTFKRFKRHFTAEEFSGRIKPLLSGMGMWGVVFMIFISVSMKAKTIISNPHALLAALFVLFLFYLINYSISICGSRLIGLNRADSYTLVFSTALRNLGISLGIATVAFGPQAALMISIAFLVQPLLAVWFIKLSGRYGVIAG